MTKYLTPEEGKALSCIVCDKKMTNTIEHTPNQPHGGIAFFTDGHYGSTVFDPMDGSCIEITVCDECIKRKSASHVNYYNPPELNPEMIEAMNEQFGHLTNDQPVIQPLNQQILESLGVTDEIVKKAIKEHGNMLTPEQLGIDSNEMKAMLEYMGIIGVSDHSKQTKH